MMGARHFLMLALLCMGGLFAQPQLAYAAQAPTPAESCQIGGEDQGYTAKVVKCVEVTVRYSVTELLKVISSYMGPVVAALSTLAIIVFGVRTMSGEPRLAPQAFGLLIRLSLIVFFSNNLGGFSDSIFAILDQMLRLVTDTKEVSCSPYPWCGLDHFLQKLLGFGPHVTLAGGVLGLLGGALFSSTFGLMLFLIGITAIISLLLFVFQVVYMYLNAIVLIGFLLIISPLLIPFAIFYYSERYVDKWIKLLISAMLTPMMMFAFIWLFMGIFDTLIAHIFSIVPEGTLKSFLHTNRPLMSWLMPTDPDMVKHLAELPQLPTPEGVTPGAHVVVPPLQTVTNPADNLSMNKNITVPNSTDFGPNDSLIKQNLIYAFASLYLYTTLMKSLLEKIPEVAGRIAGSSIHFEPSPLQQFGDNINQKFKSVGKAPGDTARPPMRTS